MRKMRKIINMPEFESDIKEVEISQWFVNEGDEIHEGDVFFEVLVDKANIEIEAEVSGKVIEIKEVEGAIVPIGEEIAIIEVSD
jgi:pyruvate/2-oxoglutarate dehydrogenase complex dihydrolipoamide acyltransferase (E2) component